MPVTPQKRSFFRKKKGWEVRNVVIERDADGQFGFSVQGGVENDMLATVVMDEPKRHTKEGKIKRGDLILSINDKNVAGESHSEVVRLLSECKREVRMVVINPREDEVSISGLFSLKNPDTERAQLQADIKNKLYELVPQVTTREPKPDEEEGREYYFVSREDFLKLRDSKRLLDYREKDGHYYGTIKPNESMLTPERRAKRQESFRRSMPATPSGEGNTGAGSTNAHEIDPSQLAQIQRVVLMRNDRGKLGLAFDGGVEHNVLLSIRIIEDDANVVSYTRRPLQKGDSILAVNDVSVAGATIDEAAQIIADTPDPVELTVTCLDQETSDRLRIPSLLHSKSPSREIQAIQADLKRSIYKSSVPYTTRKPRDGESEGDPYHFVSDEQFQKMVDDGKFIEYGEKDGVRYGTPKPANTGVSDKSMRGSYRSMSKLVSQSQSFADRKIRLERPDTKTPFGLELLCKPGHGCFIKHVENDSIAEKAKVTKAMRVTQINGVNVTDDNPEAASQTLRDAQQRVELVVQFDATGFDSATESDEGFEQARDEMTPETTTKQQGSSSSRRFVVVSVSTAVAATVTAFLVQYYGLLDDLMA